jgi:hypothetical protein
MTTTEEPIFRDTLYLRDRHGSLYARIVGDQGLQAHQAHYARRGGKCPVDRVTRVRHRETGDEGDVAAVDPSTMQLRLAGDDIAERARWHAVSEWEVIGLPCSPEMAREELSRLDARRRELEAIAPPPMPALDELVAPAKGIAKGGR